MNEKGAGIGLMRHGMTQWNVEERVQGKTDIPLTSESVTQTYEFANSLIQQGISFDRIYSSALQRAIETAEIIKEVLGVKSHFIEPWFNERGAGSMEGKTFEEIRLMGKVEDDMAENETLFERRVLRAFEAINKREQDSKILIVSHAAVTKALLHAIGQRQFATGRVPHNTIFFLTQEGDGSIIR